MNTNPNQRPQPRRHTLDRRALFLLVGIFLLLFGSRVIRLDTLDLQKDEVWSAWQTLGSVQETIQWTPYDWSPAYYLLVHGWRALTGIDPITLRVLTLLTLLVTASLLYRVGRRLFGVRAALIAVLAFGGFGYSLFISTLLRAYLLNVGLWLLALWIALDYLEPGPRPNRRRALLLGVVLAAMFYIHVTAIFAILALGLFTLVYYGTNVRRVIRLWIVPALVFGVLALPEAINKLQIVSAKNAMVNKYIPYVEPPTRILRMYQDFAGNQGALWALLVVLAGALILERRWDRRLFGLLVWLVAPIPLLWLTAFIDAYNPRHLPWIMVGFALWIGWGLSLLPRAALAALTVALLVIPFDAIPLNQYETIPRVPLVTSFNTLRQVARASDALLVDPGCTSGQARCAPVDPEEWDFFIRAYFPQGGLPLLNTGQIAPFRGYRRIWYIAKPGSEDPATFDLIQKDRALSLQFGAADLRFRLYELPPAFGSGTLYANGMRFLGAELLNNSGLPGVFHEGEMVKIRLWWTAEKAIPLDYSVVIGQIDPAAPDAAFKSQADGPPTPLDGPKETSRWPPDRIYLEERALKLSYPIPTGEQQIVMAVYQWWDGVRVDAPGLNADNLIVIGTVFVKSL